MHADTMWCRSCTTARTCTHGLAEGPVARQNLRFAAWCVACEAHVAVWCTQCYLPEDIQKKLCSACQGGAKCVICGPRGGKDVLAKMKCSMESCSGALVVCAACLKAAGDTRLLCSEHWQLQEFPCMCSGCDQSAKEDPMYARRCVSCFQKERPLYDSVLGRESKAVLEAYEDEQDITWKEPALQNLFLPIEWGPRNCEPTPRSRSIWIHGIAGSAITAVAKVLLMHLDSLQNSFAMCWKLTGCFQLNTVTTYLG